MSHDILQVPCDGKAAGVQRTGLLWLKPTCGRRGTKGCGSRWVLEERAVWQLLLSTRTGQDPLDLGVCMQWGTEQSRGAVQWVGVAAVQR